MTHPLLLLLASSVHSSGLETFLFFLEVVADIRLCLLELFLGVSKLPCKRKANLAQWYLYRHVLHVICIGSARLNVELVAKRCEEHQTQVKLVLEEAF